jgi:hypothetical protein
MGVLSDDLDNLGYEPTDKESPFDEDGQLWTKGYELVCDETGAVIRKDTNSDFRYEGNGRDEKVYRYQNSEKVKLPGGYTGSYDWGKEDNSFYY